MKIKAVRAKLLGGIKAVQDVVKTTDETSPYRNIRVETPTAGSVLLTGSNGNIQIQTRVVCETDGACALTLVGHRLAAFVGSMREGVVEIDVGTGSRARIHGGEAEFSIAKGEANDFPLMKGPDGEGRVEYAIRAGLLVEMLRKVHYAASADRTRPTLMGVLLRTRSALPGMDSVLLAVAADGRRLSVVSVEVGEGVRRPEPDGRLRRSRVPRDGGRLERDGEAGGRRVSELRAGDPEGRGRSERRRGGPRRVPG